MTESRLVITRMGEGGKEEAKRDEFITKVYDETSGLDKYLSFTIVEMVS